MDQRVYELLTARERDCLRLLSRDREPHEIAAELDIAPGTLANHIKNARAKPGGITRYQAARDLRAYEDSQAAAPASRRPEPPVAVQREASLALDMRNPLGTLHQSPGRQPVGDMTLREERAVFLPEGPTGSASEPNDRPRSGLGRSGGLGTVLLIVSIVAAIAICSSLAFSIGEGAQRLANVMEMPRH